MTINLDATPGPQQPHVTPGQVPDLRTELLEKWKPGGIYERLISTGVVTSMFHPDATARKYPNEQVVALTEAGLYWTSHEMVDVLNSAARTIPADVTPADLNFPAPHGLVYFETPIYGTDAHDHLSPNLTAELERAAIEAGLPLPISVIDNREPPVFPIHCIVWATGVQAPIPDRPRPTPSVSISSYQYRAEMGWMNLGKSDWPLTDPLDQKPFPTSDVAFNSFMEDRRLLAALFTLLYQESIAETETVMAPRHVRRRAERAGVKAISDVRLVRLRRTKHTRPDDGETHEVAWSHRWMVNGHMAWRACGPGRMQRRLVYIPPHIKGPDDKPFRGKETVNVWVR